MNRFNSIVGEMEIFSTWTRTPKMLSRHALMLFMKLGDLQISTDTDSGFGKVELQYSLGPQHVKLVEDLNASAS